MSGNYDMTQKRPDESVDDYQSRPLFEKPGITKVISRHSGSVLDKSDPHVTLTPEEQETFDEIFKELGDEEGQLPMENFSQLLEKFGIKLSKDSYVTFVDLNVEFMRIDTSVPLSHSTAVSLFCKVYAPALKFGSRLRTAAGRSDVAALTELVSRGCDYNSADGNGHTPLHHACFYGQRDMIKCLHSLSDKTSAASKLVLDAKDNRGWTPLMCSASNGYVEASKQLIDIGAKLFTVNLEGRNCLHIAAGKGKDKIVNLILAQPGGNNLVNVQSLRGWTPIFDACIHQHEEVMKLLIKAGADVNVKDMLGFTCNHYLPDESVWEKITVIEPVAVADSKASKRK